MEAAEIQNYLNIESEKITLQVEQEVTSTNTLLFEKAKKGEEEGYVLLANAQSAGRGRQGHSFYSPKDSGIYMSLLLRPQKAAITDAARITSMAAVAVCEAIEKVVKKPAQIKWVNDVFMDGRKVCGILTEGFPGADGSIEFVILGIGVNVFKPEEGFPKELENIAGAAFLAENETGSDDADKSRLRQEDKRNHLAAEIINRFMIYYRIWDKSGYIEKYKERSLVMDRVVTVLHPEGEKKARVLSMDEDCHLQVQYEDGKTAWLHSGEISIRL
ncbi:BirA family transcriptional regulator, biotin operon repressor / biotin-[acetyl-CoA-carboxylase] ligase [Lachnospiraceae bacterium XBB1006]|nr:BirA family transcriptional regulator, biotin operon repressor / biotin-[acetyl-CoA-carboxylase] ligase [Lachnospiraceae bacterium XBB1006]